MIILKQQFIKQQFIQFLKQNNAYEQYMLNFNNRSKMSKYYSKKAFKKYFKFTEEKLLITNAFDWDKTKEGFDYWDKIDDKW